MVDRGYSGKGLASGGGVCRVGAKPAKTVFDPKTFAFRQTAPYTVAQIRAFFGLG
jgi:hypothetical protein